jgi:hypothetical protein
MLSLLAGVAQAEVVISNHATKHMICSRGVCKPTAVNAVLNTGELETLLASGNLKVTTTGSGVQANDIEISDAFSWNSGSHLTLDANDALRVGAAVAVGGQGGLAILTGQYDALFFSRKGHVSFAHVSSHLSIDGGDYLLENSIKSLALAISNNPNGAYALASSYDAGKDGMYSVAPISILRTGGRFEGLGNTISNLTIVGPGDDLGLFAVNFEGALIRDITLSDVSVTATKPTTYGYVGALVAENDGGLIGAHATGTVTGASNMYVGGLVGDNSNRGGMSDNDADVAVVIVGANSSAGGLAGGNAGPISECYAIGSVKGRGKNLQLGGLVGFNGAQIENSYARGSAEGGKDSGGLMGYNGVDLSPGNASSSYSIGQVQATRYAGGLVGFDEFPGVAGDTKNNYWDTSTSKITNPGQGAGSPSNDPGITGLTTTELRSGLPAGFDSSVWAQSSTVNDGLPYLLADPPPLRSP